MIILGEEIRTSNNYKISPNSHRLYTRQYSGYSNFASEHMNKFKFVNANQAAFGLERLEQAVARARKPDDVMTAVKVFMDGAEQVHDMTYLWLERV